MEKNSSGVIDFSRTIYEMRRHWYYYVVAFVLFVGFGIFYLYKKNPVYLFHSNMLIEQGDNSGAPAGMAMMMRNLSFGSFSGGSVDDEMIVVSSRSLITEMIEELKLNRTYIEKDGLRNLPLYKNSPVEIKAPDATFDTISKGLKFIVDIKQGDMVDIKVKSGRFTTLFESTDVKLPATVSLPIGGLFVVDKTPFMKDAEGKEIVVVVQNTHVAAEDFQSNMGIDYASKKANGILCEIKDNNIERGKDKLNKIFELYNRRRLGDKNKKSSAELEFIDSRLASLTGQLKDSERKLESFKTANEITDIGEEARVLLEQSTASNKEIVQFQTQMAVFDMILEFLNDPKNKYSMIPVTSGVEYESAANSIGTYNDLVMQRMRLDMSAKKDNKMLQMLNTQIDAMRFGVIETIHKAKQSAQIAYEDFMKERSKYTGRLKSLPLHEREFVDLTRDREIKNSLYMFLIEQRENSLLKIGANYPVGRVVDVAYNDIEPVAPSKPIVLGAALLLSLLLPTFWFMYRSLNAKDIILGIDIKRFLQTSAIGEIPHGMGEKVDFTTNSATAEAMRELRNTLLKSDAKTVMVTSILPDAGKCFIAENLARLLSLSDYKIAIIDANPEGKVCKSMGLAASSKGISDFTADAALTYESVMATEGNISLIPAGKNFSTELLLTQRFKELVSNLKNSFDYVIIGTGALSESSTAAKASDIVDYSVIVIRSGENRKELVERYSRLINQFDTAKTGIVLNDVK